MKATPIPAHSRALVSAREQGRCLRCGSPRGTDWHHRRSRSVHDPHTHCACVGVLLCRTCHKWAHSNPFEARAEGLIVSRHEPHPWTVPVVSYFGRLLMACDGTFDYTYEQETKGAQ